MLRAVIHSYRAAFHGLTRELWILSCVALVNRSGTMVLPFLALYLTSKRGMSPVQAGWLLAVWGAGSLAGSWAGGAASDRLGPATTQELSLLASGASFLVLAWLRDPVAIFVGVFVTSLVADAFRPAVMASVAAAAPEGMQGRAFALLRLAINVGMTLGPAFGGLLAVHSYTWLFVVDAVTCWAAAILLSRLLPRASRPAPGAASRPAAAGSPWTDGPFLALLLLVLALAVVLFQCLSTYPLYLREHYGMREDAIGALFAVNAAIIVVFEMLLMHWVEQRDKMWLVGAGSALLALGFGMAPLGTTFAFALACLVVWTLGEMLALPLLNAVVALRAARGQRGSYMGVYTMSFAVALMIAPVGGMFVYERWGPETLWYAVAASALPLWLGCAALSRPLGSR